MYIIYGRLTSVSVRILDKAVRTWASTSFLVLYMLVFCNYIIYDYSSFKYLFRICKQLSFQTFLFSVSLRFSSEVLLFLFFMQCSKVVKLTFSLALFIIRKTFVIFSNNIMTLINLFLLISFVNINALLSVQPQEFKISICFFGKSLLRFCTRIFRTLFVRAASLFGLGLLLLQNYNNSVIVLELHLEKV